MSTSHKTKQARRDEWKIRDEITKQLGNLQDCQRNVQLMHRMTGKNNTAEFLEKLTYARMELDSELRDQFRNLLEGVSAHKLEQIQLIKDQENTTNEIIVLQKQGEEMREEIQQIHKLMARISVGGSHFNSSSRAPLTEEFDI